MQREIEIRETPVLIMESQGRLIKRIIPRRHGICGDQGCITGSSRYSTGAECASRFRKHGQELIVMLITQTSCRLIATEEQSKRQLFYHGKEYHLAMHMAGIELQAGDLESEEEQHQTHWMT